MLNEKTPHLRGCLVLVGVLLSERGELLARCPFGGGEFLSAMAGCCFYWLVEFNYGPDRSFVSDLFLISGVGYAA